MIEKMIQGWMKMQQQALPGISELQREFMEGIEKMKSGFDPSKSQKLMENGILDQKTKYAIEQIGKNPFSINALALYGSSGLWSHSNVRGDVFDLSPQPDLIEMIKSL